MSIIVAVGDASDDVAVIIGIILPTLPRPLRPLVRRPLHPNLGRILRKHVLIIDFVIVLERRHGRVKRTRQLVVVGVVVRRVGGVPEFVPLLRGHG